MSQAISFSVVIPTLNEEKYIGILLAALTKQTYKHFRIILVDGNSEDNTTKEAEKFKNELDLKIITTKKRGVSFQRNLGAKHAKEENLVFFDADTKPAPTFLEKLAEKVQKRNLDAATAWNIPLSNKLTDHVLFSLFNILYIDLLHKIRPGGTGVFMYVKKHLFQKAKGFNEKIHFAEDFDLIRRLHKMGMNFGVLRDPGIHFSVRRLEKEGRLKFAKKILRGAWVYHTKGTSQHLNKFTKEHKVGKF